MSFENLILQLGDICEERHELLEKVLKLNIREEILLRQMKHIRKKDVPHPDYEVGVLMDAMHYTQTWL